MDDIQRIRKMVEDGRITAAEGDRLIAVLREVDGAEDELAASGQAIEHEADAVAAAQAAPAAPRAPEAQRVGEAPDAPSAARPQDAARPADAARPTDAAHAAAGPSDRSRDWVDDVREAGTAAVRAAGEAVSEVTRAVFGSAVRPPAGRAGDEQGRAEPAPEGTRWVIVQLLAGDLDVSVDPDLSEPALRGAEGGVRIERQGDDFRVVHDVAAGQGAWVDTFLARVRHGDVDLRIPPGFGLELAMTAGDVDLRGVPYLRGRLTSGDLDARGLRGIDFATAAGDVDVELLLTSGTHVLRATAGDVNVRLTSGSSVRLAGSVSIGDASVRGRGLHTSRRGIGETFEGTIGDGAAQLRVTATTGDVEIRADDE